MVMVVGLPAMLSGICLYIGVSEHDPYMIGIGAGFLALGTIFALLAKSRRKQIERG